MIKTYEIDLDDKLVDTASEIFETLGSDIDTAIKMFLTQATLRKGFPFDVTIPEEKKDSDDKTDIPETEKEVSEKQVETSVESEQKAVSVSENECKPEPEAFTESKPEIQKPADVSDNVTAESEAFSVSNTTETAVFEMPVELSADEKSDVNVTAENVSASNSENNSDSEDEDETAPENLFDQWNFEDEIKK